MVENTMLLIPIVFFFFFPVISSIIILYGALRIPAGIRKRTFIVLMIFALAWPFLYFAAAGIWTESFRLTYEHFRFLEIFVWGIIVVESLFYAFLGMFVFKTFRRQYLFLTFTLFWILLVAVLNAFLTLVSFNLR